MKVLTLSQAFDAFVLYKRATGKSENTLRNYRTTFDKVRLYFHDDPPFADITLDRWIGFFAWLQDEYVAEPDGVAPRGPMMLSPKSVTNIHTDLSSFYTWAAKHTLVKEHLIRQIERPQYEPPTIEPFTHAQIQTLLRACETSRTWKTRDTQTQRPTAERDQLIIRLLLDTGMRADELCHIRYKDVDMSTRAIQIAGKGKGRDKKKRVVYFGKRTARDLWDYLLPRLDKLRDDDWLLTVDYGQDLERPMTRTALDHLLKRIGERANIANVYPHRFRHTFAITYLRNGGDLLTLQVLLGHNDLRMVKRYAKVVAADCAAAHESASPVDNWGL